MNIANLIDSLFDSRVGIILVSLIWGLGIATIFKKTCIGSQCNLVEYRSPEDVNNKTFYLGTQNNPECYQYIPYATACPSKNLNE